MLAAATVFFQGLSVAHPLLDPDEAGYGSIAGLMNAGGALYAAGGVDNKPPVVFWVYSLVFRGFGLYDMTAVHVVKVLVVLATAVFVGLIARRLAGAAAGWIAAIVYVAFTTVGYAQMAAANTEVFMMLPAAASVWLLLDGRWAWSGAALALAVMTKQVAVLQVALFPLAAVTLGGGLRRLPAAAGGFAAALAGLLAIVALTGSLEGFWRWTVVSVLTNYGPTAWSAGQVLSDAGGGLVPWLQASPFLTVPALLRAVLVPRVPPEERLVQAWLLTSLAGAVAGGHFFGHYFIELVGPLAVLTAVALAGLRRAGRWALPAVVAAALLAAPAVGSVLINYRGSGVGPVPVTDYLAAHTGPADRLFVWGNTPEIYYFSDRLPGTRFPGFLRGFPRGLGLPPRSWDTTPDVWTALAQDFQDHPPLYIVDTSPPDWRSFGPYPMSRFPVLAAIVQSRYEKEAVVDGFVLYRLR